MNLNNIFLFFCFLFFACNNNIDVKDDKGNVVLRSGKFNYYGDKLTSSPVLHYNDLITNPLNYQNKEVKLIGDIKSTCAKKGCWVRVFLSDTIELFVMFKDYSFFVPKSGVEGKKIVVEGRFSVDTTSVQSLRHFAEDGGASYEEIQKIKDPKIEYTMEAHGVMIK